jgi:response regulator NasT
MQTANPLRILVIDPDPGRAALLEQALGDCGYAVVARIGSADNLPERVAALDPDVIIIDLDSPDRDTLENMRLISRHQPRPVVMFAEDGDSRTIDKAVRAGVSAYVVDGLAAGRVRPVIEVAIARFREYHALRRELERAKSSLADRKVVDKAKGLLMQQRGLSEEQAYQALRKAAMDSNQRVADVAA